ncbi:hypothetical protein ACOSP7_013462 [Xanthoceras sorbifolium]
MSNSSSEQRDHQRDHGTAMGDRDEGGGTSPKRKRRRRKRKEKGNSEEKLCEKRKPGWFWEIRKIEETLPKFLKNKV